MTDEEKMNDTPETEPKKKEAAPEKAEVLTVPEKPEVKPEAKPQDLKEPEAKEPTTPAPSFLSRILGLG